MTTQCATFKRVGLIYCTMWHLASHEGEVERYQEWMVRWKNSWCRKVVAAQAMQKVQFFEYMLRKKPKQGLKNKELEVWQDLQG